ncbi:MAG TPA: hypothetical protein VKU02_08555 [Gemmataceae bacterium]|nr:hypothetical protein [Gemmataceae bacterium]
MKSSDAILAFLSLVFAMPARAEEPFLDFVRGLRQSGKADLALQYLQSEVPRFPAALVPLVPLERGLTRLELAAAQPDAAGRAALYDQAEAEFNAFIGSNPKHRRAPEAILGLARIAALRGRAHLSEASQEEAKEAQRETLLRARTLFEQAAKQLQAAKTQMDEQLQLRPATPQAQDENLTLMQAQGQAELEQGINLLDQAKTFMEATELTQRGALIKKARAILDKLAKAEPKSFLSWQALAWLGYALFEDEDPKAARRIYMEVINAEAGGEADVGRRLARCFRIQALTKEADPKRAMTDVVNAAEEWLRLYPQYANTPEGYGVRFELANGYRQQAQLLGKTSNLAREKLEQARKQFEILEQSDNDYTAIARENRLNLVLLTSLDRTKGEIQKLRDFEECYLRAEYERAKLAQAKKELSGAKFESQRKLHLRNLVEALNRGLDLAGAATPKEDLNQARLYLAYAYLALEDDYRAAVAGEELARTEPKSAQAAMAGAYALSAYAQLLAKREQAGAVKEDLEVERRRQRELAQYIERTWPTSQAADIARHMLGVILFANKEYVQAVEELNRISSGYSDATRSLYQLAGAALAAQKSDLKPPAGKPSYEQRALAALARIPDLKTGADTFTARDYFAAKLMLAEIYFKAKQYDKLEALAPTLAKHLDGVDEKVKDEFRTPVLSLTLYAKLGRAEIDYRAGQYGKAYGLLGPVVKELTDSADGTRLSELKEKNPQLLRALLAFALRASVGANKIEQGKQILDLVQKTFPENSQETLAQLVQQLRSHIDDLRRQGTPAREQLEQTVTNFSLFLAELAKQHEKSAKPEMTLFLGQSYSSLDQHGKAAELFRSIPPEAPPALSHWARILYVRELRLGKEFAKAEAALKELSATDWGKQHLEVRKEGILLLEDQQKYQLSRTEGAIPQWNQLMLSLRPKLQDNKIKEQYFDCYCHLTYCIFQNALKKSDKKQRDKEIRTAASFIARFEDQTDSGIEPYKQRLQELRKQDPLLQEAYESIKKNASEGKK